MSYTALHSHVVPASAYGTVICGAWFCEGWEPPFGLLGQEDFLAQYRLHESSREAWFTLLPEAPAPGLDAGR